MNLFSKTLDSIIQNRGLSNNKAAGLCHMDTSLLRRYRNGERVPRNEDILDKLREGLHLSQKEYDKLYHSLMSTKKNPKGTDTESAVLSAEKEQFISALRSRSLSQLLEFQNISEHICKKHDQVVEEGIFIKSIETENDLIESISYLMAQEKVEDQSLYIISLYSSLDESRERSHFIVPLEMDCNHLILFHEIPDTNELLTSFVEHEKYGHPDSRHHYHLFHGINTAFRDNYTIFFTDHILVKYSYLGNAVTGIVTSDPNIISYYKNHYNMYVEESICQGTDIYDVYLEYSEKSGGGGKMSEFSNYLNELKNNYSFKIIDLARKCPVDTNTLYSWFSGRSTPASATAIDIISDGLNLSKKEKMLLEKSYMETAFGEGKYYNYLIINELIAYIFNECLNPLDINHSTVNIQLPEESPYFQKISTYNIFLVHLQSLFLNAAPEDTIYIVLDQTGFSLLNTIKDLFLLSGPKKLEIILCSPLKSIFKSPKASMYLKTLFELFIYNNDINVMVLDHEETVPAHNENCIFSNEKFITFDNELGNGAVTTYPEWIIDYKNKFQYWKTFSNTLGNKSISAADYVNTFEKPRFISVYEFMPCFTVNMDYELLDKHFYPDIPDRETIITMILQGFVLSDETVIDIFNISSIKGVRTFMDTGFISTYPFPIYDPFSLEERIMLLEKLIGLIKKGIYHQRLHKYQVIDNSPMIQLELHDYNTENNQLPAQAHADFYLIQKDLEVHKICFYNPQIIDWIKDFFEVVSNPRYCYTEEESLKILEDILEEYRKKL